ncbi:hybrid sensor histidine kinase/response regulator [Halorientalis pallida]|uniref:histidine kinase n=1 Tax=Halorientalis pallida TaxID=2479928 RepID=A0A498KTE1_9EURY|nr:ATP-binding protein [Halorientalis pallida]RXK47314.1 PAS domain S-box protein [Halorientalis pallida]
MVDGSGPPTVLVAPEPDPDALSEELAETTEVSSVETAERGAAALEMLDDGAVGAVLSAAELADMDGVDLLERARRQRPTVPFVLFSRDGDERLVSDALSVGVTEYVPVESDPDADILADRLSDALARVRPDLTGKEEPAGRFEQLVEFSTDVLTIHRRDGTVRYVNPIIEDIMGYSPAECVDQNPVDRIHPDDRDRVLSFFADPKNWLGETRQVTYRMQTAAGEWRTLESVAHNRLRDPALAGVVVNSRDVTEREQYQRELERQNERLERFASVVSHDLRNPLQVIRARVEAARAESGSGHHDHIEDAVDRMEALIDDVLTLARDGQVIGELGETDLEGCARAAWGRVNAPDATLECRTDCAVEADADRLVELLQNLYSNAVTHGGHDVTVRLGVLGDDPVGFYVEDDGPGILPDERDFVFDYGYTTGDGTGMGLAIVREIAQAHGWDVSLAEEGDGTRFEFTGVTVCPNRE